MMDVPTTQAETVEPVLVSASLLDAVLAYVERMLGPSGLAEVLAEAEVGDRPAQGTWTTDETIFAVARAAARLTGERDIGYRAGEQLMAEMIRTGMDSFIHATGDIACAFALSADYGSNMSANRVMRIADVGADHVRIEASYGVVPEDDFFCRLQLGYYAQLPGRFGGDCVAAETRCQVRGDASCEFVVRWRADAEPRRDASEAAEASDAIIRVFEDVHAMASELARANDVEAALDAIIERVGHAIMAPRFVLAARLRDGEPPRVHALNMSADAARAVAAAIESGSHETPFGTAVVAPVVGSRSYGFLAALLVKGKACTPGERRSLHAYAGYAAVVLDTAQAFEQARRDRDVSQSLLDLANELAAARTRMEVASLVAEAAPHVVGGGRGGVWLYTEEGMLQRAAPLDPDTAPATLSNARIPAILAMRTNPRPLRLEGKDMGPVVAPLFEARGLTRALVAPIVARGDVLGLVSISCSADTCDADTDDGLSRLAALADIAASALDNVRLIERVRYQALHDALTGLPNRVLASDIGRAHISDANAQTSLLFIDLDDFKGVNDRLGHAAGDRLLQLASERIARHLRPSDTIARFAGDEFVVILPACASVEHAQQIADRISEAFVDPFEVEGKRVHIGASVGVSTAPVDGNEYDLLLKAADTAMYAVKSAQRRLASIADG